MDCRSAAMRVTRRARASATAEAAMACVHDHDIMLIVLSKVAIAVGGWCPALWEVGSVCSEWREVIQAVRRGLEEWTEFRWDVLKMSQCLTTPQRIYSPIFTCGGGAYDWRLLLCIQPDLTLSSEDEAQAQRFTIALYLCLPEQDGMAAIPHPRETQFEFQILSPSEPRKHAAQATNVDIGTVRTWSVRSVEFSRERGTWGNPRFLEAGKLREAGCVGDADTLHLACHLRVRNGRKHCPAAATHTLALADPRRTYARYGGLWHCDKCGKGGKPGALDAHAACAIPTPSLLVLTAFALTFGRGCDVSLQPRVRIRPVQAVLLRARTRQLAAFARAQEQDLHAPPERLLGALLRLLKRLLTFRPRGLFR